MLDSSHALREACIEFIVGHASQIIARQEWKDLKVCTDYFKVVTDTYETILKQTIPGFKDSEFEEHYYNCGHNVCS